LISGQNKEYTIIDLFAPDSKPYGTTYSEWTVRWWQWCLSQPNSSNPVNARKRTDRNAANNQIWPDVWFLAGTTGGYAERECAIPRGKAILCPIINFEVSTAEEPNLRSDEELVLRARGEIDKIEKLNVTVDDKILPDLKNFRVETGPFDITLPEDNIWGVKAGPTRAAADGYWLFLKPLAHEPHEIHFNGSCLAGTINIETKYYLCV
jgi:hypothetical protein